MVKSNREDELKLALVRTMETRRLAVQSFVQMQALRSSMFGVW